MNSIIVLKETFDDPSEMILRLEAVTRARVYQVVTDYNQTWFYLAHSDSPVCPECGKPLHPYGHGLCWACWQKLKAYL